jgi:glycerate kinase
VLGAAAAAAALAEGFRSGGAEALELPVADGGEGTADVFHEVLGGEWREDEVEDPLGRPVRARWLLLPDGRAVVEAAAAIGLPLLAPHELDPLRASSRGFGQLVAAAADAGATELLLGIGGVATVDGGVGLRETLGAFAQPATVLCDVGSVLADAPRLYGPQKGASPEDVTVLERRLLGLVDLMPYAALPGSGAAGGLGAALASLGAALVPGAGAVLDLLHFDDRLGESDLVVTGEGTVDMTTLEGKAPGAVAHRCAILGVRCVLFGGVVRDGMDARSLSGNAANASEDLEELGEQLARALVEGA